MAPAEPTVWSQPKHPADYNSTVAQEMVTINNKSSESVASIAIAGRLGTPQAVSTTTDLGGDTETGLLTRAGQRIRGSWGYGNAALQDGSWGGSSPPGVTLTPRKFHQGPLSGLPSCR